MLITFNYGIDVLIIYIYIYYIWDHNFLTEDHGTMYQGVVGEEVEVTPTGVRGGSAREI